MAAGAITSSSLKRQRNYDVFLSFRGVDVRNTFLSHLYKALDQNGLFTYIDSKERKGEQIMPALMKAIEESRVAIIIFSENYASSSYCLEEVAKIMECKSKNDLVVLPIFYQVEPRDVRHVRESYERDMDKHESEFGKNSEIVMRWKKALLDAGSLSGWPFKDGDEAKFIENVVKEISLQLDREPLDVAEHPVGLHAHVVKLKSMLNLGSDDALMTGLWGQGGIGKTTLAKALYNAIFRQFESSYFLANIREASRDSKDLDSLQEKLLSKILHRKGVALTSVDEGINLIRHKLCSKKVLLVLDDVNDENQFYAIVGNCKWFGQGSRIIITTRDCHLLTSLEIDKDYIYKVQTLKNCEALELFNKHAFARNNNIVIQRDTVNSALHYAGGLPLALAVLGSFLKGRCENDWKSALRKLSKDPNEKINKILELSYDGLEQNEKEIFLDIACFFKGQSRSEIMRTLDACELETCIGVQLLIEKSLIFDDGWHLQMHDLIQMMGMKIVKQECPNDLRKRSRLWVYDDVRDVLSQNKETNKVKAIVLDLPKPKQMYIDPYAFKNMRRLRMLIMINVDSSFQGAIDFPIELRVLKWPECPFTPRFPSGPDKLVVLDLSKSNIQAMQFKDFENLKFINLSECQSLVCMSDLSCAPHLEILDLQRCRNLEHVDGSIAYLQKLWSLNLLECSKLQTFPDFPYENKSLQEVNLQGTSIEKLPVSIENLVNLRGLCLQNCKKLEILPSSIYRLQNLIWLDFGGCSQLSKFPKKEKDLSDPHAKTGFIKLKRLDLGGCNLSETEFMKDVSCFPNLTNLILSGNKFANLPSCEHLRELRWLDVSDCQQLQEILKIPEKFSYLWAGGCKCLSRIPSNTCDVEYIDLASCLELVRNGLSATDLFKIEQFYNKPRADVVLPGEEMPKWLLPNEGGYISFVASKDLYNKLLGVVLSVVCRAEENCPIDFNIGTNINGRKKHHGTWRFRPSNSNMVCLKYNTIQGWWGVEDFDSDDGYSRFHLHIRAERRVLVKMCGFRIICKPLGNDLKVLLHNGRLLNPALLYEVGNNDSQTSTMEESSSETRVLQDSQMSTDEDSSSESVNRKLNMADLVIEEERFESTRVLPRNIRSGGEMPKEFVLVENDTISFMASQELYNKFFGLVLCVIFGVEDEKKEISIHIVPHVDGQKRNGLLGTLGPFDSNHMWVQFLRPDMLWGFLEGAIDFSQFKKRYLRFDLEIRVSGGTIKKLGYLLSCKRLEDDLKVVLEDNQLMNPALLFEDFSSKADCPEYFLNPQVYLRIFHLFEEPKVGDGETEQMGRGE